MCIDLLEICWNTLFMLSNFKIFLVLSSWKYFFSGFMLAILVLRSKNLTVPNPYVTLILFLSYYIY